MEVLALSTFLAAVAAAAIAGSATRPRPAPVPLPVRVDERATTGIAAQSPR